MKFLLLLVPALLLFVFPATPPQLAGCDIFPADNIWNTRVDSLPQDANSSAYIATIGRAAVVHADFGSGLWEGKPIGIPYVTVYGSQPKVAVSFEYADESDAGPYPIPTAAPVEGGPNGTGDRHVLVLDQDACKLYELYAAYPHSDGSWEAGSGAIFDLRSHALRPATWTSADAAGLPILPGLVRYDEVASGAIHHAIRVTAPKRAAPTSGLPVTRHRSDRVRFPPMGQRFRLKADFE